MHAKGIEPATTVSAGQLPNHLATDADDLGALMPSQIARGRDADFHTQTLASYRNQESAIRPLQNYPASYIDPSYPWYQFELDLPLRLINVPL